MGDDVNMADNAFVMLLQLLCYKMSKLEILPRRSLMEEDQSESGLYFSSKVLIPRHIVNMEKIIK